MSDFARLVSGATAGLVANVVMHPLDTVKAQTQFANIDTRHSTIRTRVTTILRQDGLRGFYKGFGTVLLSTIPSTGLYFLSYGRLKTYFGTSPLGLGLAGLGAQCIAGLIFCPRDILKERMQTNVFNGNAWRLSKHIFETEGIGGFYRGYWATTVLWGPYAAIYFNIYEHLKMNFGNPGQNSIVSLSMFGVIAAGIAGVITNPIDVIKLNFQVLTKTDGSSNSAFKVATKLWRQHGINFFFRGSIARVLWIAPRTAISFAIFEKVMETW